MIEFLAHWNMHTMFLFGDTMSKFVREMSEIENTKKKIFMFWKYM